MKTPINKIVAMLSDTKKHTSHPIKNSLNKEFRLNKTKMIKIVNEQIETQTIKSITEVVNTLLEVIMTSLENNERVNFVGIFSIDTVFVKSRSGVMFKDKIPFTTKDRYVPRVKVGKLLKEKVAQNG